MATSYNEKKMRETFRAAQDCKLHASFDELPDELQHLITDKSAVLTVRFLPKTFYLGNALPRTLEVPMAHRSQDAEPTLRVNPAWLYLRGRYDEWQASPVVRNAAFMVTRVSTIFPIEYYTVARVIKTTRLIVLNDTPWKVNMMEISMDAESPTYMHVTKSNWDGLKKVGDSIEKMLTCAEAQTRDIFQSPSPIQNDWNDDYNLHIRLIKTDNDDVTYTDYTQRTVVAAVYASERS